MEWLNENTYMDNFPIKVWEPQSKCIPMGWLYERTRWMNRRNWPFSSPSLLPVRLYRRPKAHLRFAKCTKGFHAKPMGDTMDGKSPGKAPFEFSARKMDAMRHPHSTRCGQNTLKCGQFFTIVSILMCFRAMEKHVFSDERGNSFVHRIEKRPQRNVCVIYNDKYDTIHIRNECKYFIKPRLRHIIAFRIRKVERSITHSIFRENRPVFAVENR